MGGFFSRFSDPVAMVLAAVALALALQRMAGGAGASDAAARSPSVDQNLPAVAQSGQTQIDNKPMINDSATRDPASLAKPSGDLEKKMALENSLRERLDSDSGALKDCNSHRAELQGLSIAATANQAAGLAQADRMRSLEELELSIKNLEVLLSIRRADLEACRSGLAADQAKLKQYKLTAEQLQSSLRTTVDLVNQCYKDKNVENAVLIPANESVYNLKAAEESISNKLKVSSILKKQLDDCKNDKAVAGKAAQSQDNFLADRAGSGRANR